MQHNITELTQKLLRALDNNYNVIDMPMVIEVITLVEKFPITKELLETTRLGKHINELRRNTTNDSLAKRAKELLKRWRSEVLSVPSQDTNGQIKPAPVAAAEEITRKRQAKDVAGQNNALKRPRINGASEYEFSDNSNSSFKDALVPKNVILINSDSNSSLPDVKHEPLLEEQQPKKRGRKKGSKNHKNLLDEAESSFTNKMAVSRGNAKVKTTQELIASIQNKSGGTPATGVSTSPGKNKEDWSERAAKLTERVSMIDKKLNAISYRKKKKSGDGGGKTRTVLESGSVLNIKSEPSRMLQESSGEEDIVVVDDEREQPDVKTEESDDKAAEANTFVASLTVEEALSRLPPIDNSCLLEFTEDFHCICTLDEVIGEDSEVTRVFNENSECPARIHFEGQYRLTDITRERIDDVHSVYTDNVNGNYGIDNGTSVKPDGDSDDVNKIVPNFYDLSPKHVDRDSVCENYKKYSISDCGDAERPFEFREYHQVLDKPSYNGDVLRILPYVVID